MLFFLTRKELKELQVYKKVKNEKSFKIVLPEYLPIFLSHDKEAILYVIEAKDVVKDNFCNALNYSREIKCIRKATDEDVESSIAKTYVKDIFSGDANPLTRTRKSTSILKKAKKIAEEFKAKTDVTDGIRHDMMWAVHKFYTSIRKTPGFKPENEYEEQFLYAYLSKILGSTHPIIINMYDLWKSGCFVVKQKNEYVIIGKDRKVIDVIKLDNNNNSNGDNPLPVDKGTKKSLVARRKRKRKK